MSEKQELRKGEKAYLKRVVNELKTESEKAINNFKSQSQSILDQLEKDRLKLLKSEEEERNLINLYTDAEAKLQGEIDKFNDLNDLIFYSDENETSLKDDMISYKDEFLNYKSEIEHLKKNIENYDNELFGQTNDEGQLVLGKKHVIDKYIEKTKEEISQTQDNQNKLFTKIEGLLKGASTVGLSNSFGEHKKSFKTSNIVWLILFIISIASLMFLSIWGFIKADYEFKDMWKYTLGNLPFLGGAVWLAIYASKQRSQNTRLEQEYAFKEDVAKVYYALKQEIDELSESDIGKKLNIKMLETIINVVGDNPSQTLDSKSHNDKGPVLETLKELSSLIKNTNTPI